MMKIVLQLGIMDIKFYVSGEFVVEGKFEVLKLLVNENFYGFSDKVCDVYLWVVQNLYCYFNMDYGLLRVVIVEVYGFDFVWIVCGVGLDEVFQFVVQVYVGVGDEVIVIEYGFVMYLIFVKVVGVVLIEVFEKDCCVDVDVILVVVMDKIKIVFIVNLVNLMGIFLFD